MFKKIFFCFLLSSIGYCYELEKAIEDAINHNSEIAASKEQVKSANFTSKIAIGEFLPSVSLAINTDPTLQNFSRNHIPALGNQLPSPNFNIDIKQNIFNFGGSLAKVNKGKYDYQYQKLIAQDKIQNTVMSVIGAYLEVLRFKKSVELYKENVKALERSLNAEKEKFKYGDSTKSDVAQAQSKLSKAKSELIQSESAKKDKMATFLRLVGKEPEDLLQPKIKEAELPKNLKDAISLARHNNIQLNAIYQNKKSAEFVQKSAISALLPSLDLIARFTYGDTEFNGTVETRQQLSKYFALNLSVPIFQGGREYLTAFASSRNKAYSDLIYKDSYQALEENVKIAWNDYQSSKSIIRASLDSVEAYKIALDSIKVEEKMKLKTIDDVMDAEVNLLDAKLQLIKAQNFQINSFYKLFIMVYGHDQSKRYLD